MVLLLLKDNNCAKLFWNPCTIVRVMAQRSSIYDYVISWPSSVTLTVNISEQMFQMARTSTPWGQLCQTILKSMHKCTSYGLDKRTSTHWSCQNCLTHCKRLNKNEDWPKKYWPYRKGYFILAGIDSSDGKTMMRLEIQYWTQLAWISDTTLATFLGSFSTRSHRHRKFKV